MALCSPQVHSPSAFSGTPVTDISLRHSPGSNQQTYERLKASLSLNLRRQVFIAVCDDLPLRDRLAMQLQSELAHFQENPIPPAPPSASPTSIPLLPAPARAIPKLVTLELNLDDPHPIVQMIGWLSYFPQAQWKRSLEMPAFQFLGIERLTRQPASLQNAFLDCLQTIEPELSSIESSLLLWMTQPWFRLLPEAAPEFWRCRTGVFEFVGDPTPLPTSSPERIQLPSGSSSSAGSSLPQVQPPSRPTLAAPTPAAEPVALPLPPEVQDTWDSLDPLDQDPLDQEDQRDRGIDQDPGNPWLSLADDLTCWYESELEPGSTEPVPSFTPMDAASDQDWMVAFSQILAEEMAVIEQQRLDPQNLDPQALDPQDPAPKSLATDASPDPTQNHADRSAAILSALPATALLLNLPAEAQTTAAQTTDIALLPDGALDHATPLLQHIELLQQQIALLEQGQESPTGLGIAYRTLGNFYRDCIEQGDASADNITIAIQSYEQALRWLPTGTIDQAETLNDLGNLYWMVSQMQSEPAEAMSCLQQTVQVYQQALTHLVLPHHSQTYTMVQNNLGAAYADLARYQEPITHLQQSVKAYQQALQYRTVETDPSRYASTQNNLGTTFWNLAQHQQPQLHLQQAILAYSAALRHYDPALDPLTYAMIQNNLGTAYWNLAQYEQPQDYLQLALASYQTALQYRTLEASPSSFAATQNNLGTAYWHLANHLPASEQATYLQQAISAYETALQVAFLPPPSNPVPLTFDLDSTQNNLGLAYYQLAIDVHANLSTEAQTSYLHRALQQQLAVLQNWHHNPDLRQTALNCLLQTVRAFYTHLGLAGQNQALAQIPPALLPEILPKL